MARVATRRKTPSELRAEQLKKAEIAALQNDSIRNSCQVDNSTKNLVDSHINDVYPIKKPKIGVTSSKNDTKENNPLIPPNIKKSLFEVSTVTPENLRCDVPVACSNASKKHPQKPSQTTEKISQNVFKTVKELSSIKEAKPSLAALDMEEALKGLYAYPKSEDLAHSSDTFKQELSITGPKPPLDYTLKTLVRISFNTRSNWIHRAIMSSTFVGVPDFEENCGSPIASQILSSKALHSWVYPQSVLPPCVISALNSSASGGSDFLSKRHVEWGDSFRSLYYMFRKNKCNLFYVCSSQFIVMFRAHDAPSGKRKRLCKAYISRSTRTLRSLLKENNIPFSMPLCNSEVEQPKAEVLMELAEIEKQNFRQTRRTSSFNCIDDSPESLLSFVGNDGAHGLYGFLLDYRSLLNSLYGDVPILYSPVPFQNGAISSPQIKCAEMKRVEDKCDVFFSSIEIKDIIIPPWVVSRACSLVGSKGDSFEISFVTDRPSIGLNTCFETWSESSDEAFKESGFLCGESEGVIVPRISSGFLKMLKYNGCRFELSLSS